MQVIAGGGGQEMDISGEGTEQRTDADRIYPSLQSSPALLPPGLPVVHHLPRQGGLADRPGPLPDLPVVKPALVFA